MPLGLVSEVVAHGGTLPQLAELGKKRKFLTKKTGVTFGVFWFAFLIFLTAFFGILNAPGELLGITALTAVFGGILSIVGSLILLPSSKQPTFQQHQVLDFLHSPASVLDDPVQPQALNAQPASSQNAYGPPTAGSWRDTNDLQPATVTESTTRLLTDQEKP